MVKEILGKLIEKTSSESAIIVNSDGLVIESVNADNEDRTAVMIASLHTMGERFSTDLDRGSVEQFYIKTALGYVLLKNINENVIIGLVAKDDAKLGLLMLHLDETVNELKNSL